MKTPNPQSPQRVKIGLFGVGLAAYWNQFDGLRDTLLGHQRSIRDRLAADPGVEVVDVGLVDDEDVARAAGEHLRREGVELLFLYVATYALSSVALPVVQRANVPVIVLNLQPERAIDYTRFNALRDRTAMTGQWLGFCQGCSVPEFSNVFQRAGIAFHQATGVLHDDPVVWGEIEGWVAAAKARHVLRDNRVGMLGHYYNGMLDVYSDATQHATVFGCHLQHLEFCELLAHSQAATDADVACMLDTMRTHFEIGPDCTDDDLRAAARTAVGLDALVAKHRLGSLCYFHVGSPQRDYEDLVSTVIVGTSLLTARGVPVAGEYELKNVQAMKLLDALGAGGSFTEFYAMDYDDDVVLMGHDGPGHIAIAEGKTRLRALDVYHGKVGRGLSVEMSVRHGPVTLLSVVDAEPGRLKLVVAEGESVAGPILEIGNTNSRYRFACGARRFVEGWCQAGPAHHCAVGIGHRASVLRKVATLLGIDCITVA